MKKIVFCILFSVIVSFFCFSESYKINTVDYDISGITREYALSQKVPVDTATVFKDYPSFEKYINDLKQLLNNQRVFQSTDVEMTFLDASAEGVIPVNLTIIAEDTLNIVAVPYPAYNSNTGLTLKIKVKDYNFFGSMEEMNFDLNYQAKGSDQEALTHVYGINFDFEVPFKIVNLPASWNSSFSFEYIVGGEQFDMDICEGIGVSVPIAGVTSADFAFNQYYIQDSEYLETDDSKYFEEEVSVSFPFLLTHIPDFSDLTWTPRIGFDFTWDFDAFDGLPYYGITEEEIRGPSVSVGHTLSADRINWFGNFRDGASASLGQTFSYNLYDTSKSFNLTLEGEYHNKINNFIGFSSRGYWYKDFFDKSEEPGRRLRGIRDRDYDSPDYLMFNFDLPVKVFQTNWGKLFGWDKLSFIDFEFQAAPFIDVALMDNIYNNTYYDYKDGLYGAGLEMLVYPSRFRSLQGRISFGVDCVQFLDKVGNKVSKLDGLSEKLFNMDWRDEEASSWFELSIGIGLFY